MKTTKYMSKNFLKDFTLHWKNYILQSLLAVIVVFIVLTILSINKAVIVASIGATAFIIFAMPKSITAKPRNVIGGYIVGILVGSLFFLIPKETTLTANMLYALAVGLSILIMVIIDTEHPPASGVALGVALEGLNIEVTTTILVGIIVMSMIHHIFRNKLRDLV
jgi:CBS-domain-containing membrane protein